MNIAVPVSRLALARTVGDDAPGARWPMRPGPFRAALMAEIELLRHDDPADLIGRRKAWMIVECGLGAGPAGEMRGCAPGGGIAIGFAGADNVNGRRAPARLRVATMRHALIFAVSGTAVEGLLSRQPIAGCGLEGVFEPSEGWVRLDFTRNGPRLTGFGRQANGVERQNGRAVLVAGAGEAALAAALAGAPGNVPGAGFSNAFAWRISAGRRSWCGEIMPA